MVFGKSSTWKVLTMIYLYGKIFQAPEGEKN